MRKIRITTLSCVLAAVAALMLLSSNVNMSTASLRSRFPEVRFQVREILADVVVTNECSFTPNGKFVRFEMPPQDVTGWTGVEAHVRFTRLRSGGVTEIFGGRGFNGFRNRSDEYFIGCVDSLSKVCGTEMISAFSSACFDPDVAPAPYFTLYLTR